MNFNQGEIRNLPGFAGRFRDLPAKAGNIVIKPPGENKRTRGHHGIIFNNQFLEIGGRIQQHFANFNLDFLLIIIIRTYFNRMTSSVLTKTAITEGPVK